MVHCQRMRKREPTMRKRLPIMLTPDERAMLEATASRTGKTLAEVVRDLIKLEHARASLLVPGPR
jgi:uncharacterized protein (DUF1778 family)